MANIFNGIKKASIYLLVFLIPLFWLPFSFEAFEFNKQYLLFFLVSLAFFAWLAEMILVDKELRFKKTPLDIFVAAFIFIAILSAIFSVDRGSSIFGFYGRFSDGLIGLLSLGVLYFLITNNVGMPLKRADLNAEETLKLAENQRRAQRQISESGLIKTLMWSVFFVILFSYLSIFGGWQHISNFKLQISKFTFQLPHLTMPSGFNPVSGSMEGLALFLSIVLVLLVGLILFLKLNFKQVAYWILLIAALGLLIIIDFNAAWIVVLISLALFTIFALWKRIFRENINKLLLPIFLIIIASISLGLNIPKPDFVTLPQEQVLAPKTSWQIGLGAATENLKSKFLGSGIGTLFYDFTKFKPVEFNQNLLWQIRFDRPNSHLAEILGTMGFLGIISYLILIGMFLLISQLFLETAVSKSKSQPQNYKQFPLLTAFIALIVGQFVYYQNTVLAFIFWLILGLSMVSWQKPLSEKILPLKESPELGLVTTVALIVIGLGILGTYYFGQQFYRADIAFANSQRLALSQERRTFLEKAVSLNPTRAQYQLILARAYLNEVLNEVRKPPAEQNFPLLQATVAKAIDTAKASTRQGPGQVLTWETLAMIYRDVRLIVTGATEWGIKSFEKAITLEPTNPVLHTELGKLLAIDNPGKAKEEFAKAIELKPDYVDAQIQSVLIYEREGNLEEAIKKMENLSLTYPLNSEVLFQLGRLYFNANKTDEAISRLEKAVELMPNYSNALYSLGIAYNAKGEKEKAIKAFEKVLKLNPGNPDVMKKLEELKSPEVKKEEVKKK